ncbi:hypothetical protein SAMN05216337_1017145 [Bradyrhizobium brasilense]|uniref:Ubiquitin-activating enzyme E1 FCCH domain-containing protein n=1 Tax=Bradyrhizobium brasilense TaxID=1419277 RepID=A0A1G6Z0K2_9BRAD|nr:hypothetical protein [Bradyrhizobium brasilense]SDD95437.1 hypothetical protein SAMN05216337_1017145 [Bradyrhizobium brasilense]
MAVPLNETAFVVGEVTPSLFGHTDLARLRSGAATMRNLWPNYHGGAYSRAGTAFVGFSKQTGRNYPPRMIPFQFGIKQGLALEFGHLYMRVISDGAFVTDAPFAITAASQTKPATVTINPTSSAVSAVPANGGVTASYAAGDTVTLAGGTFTAAAQLLVQSTSLLALAINNRGSGYVPGEGITLNGGSPTIAGKVLVTTTRVKSATIAYAGSGLVNGAQVAVGITGTGIPFQVNVTVAGNQVTAINAFVSRGSYTQNPVNLAAEPVTLPGIPGSYIAAQFSLVMEINTIAISDQGSYIANAVGGTFTQASSTGAGVGATFNNALFGPNAVTVTAPGSYSDLPLNPVNQSATSGTGSGGTFNMTWNSPPPIAAGDWVSIAGVQGMTELNGNTYVVQTAGTVLQLYDVYGNAIDATGFGAYTGGGTASRIYTLATPYAEQDLRWLKYTQSADVMSLCLVNQDTGAEYAPQDLARLSADSWEFRPAIAQPSVAPPATVSGVATTAGTADYQYVVTSVNPADGSESIASPIAGINAAVDISATAGNITITWSTVVGINEYNVYKATPAYGTPPPVGALFGYAGKAFGNQFVDRNIVPDFSQVPPLHKNPFARGQVVAVSPSAQGAGYTQAVATVASFTGSGAVIVPVIVGGAVVAYIVKDAGSGYVATDVVNVSGDGAGAAASVVVGAETGTYPGVVAYFQQRRFYGYTINNPDTYFASQPGAYTNFDSRIPTIDSDAIIGTPWSVQVNGIQFFLAMPGGLVAFTGATVWQLGGSSGGSLNPQPITPSSQSAQPQSSTGCSATVGPIRIQSDILYVQAKNSNYIAANYQIYANNYVTDFVTLTASHLFTGYEIIDHAWCEEPYKLLWAIRNDGCMLSLTYLRPQEVIGWARHDTNGLFVSLCSITELPYDALYVATQRFPGNNTAYMIERMNNRVWGTVEDTWCVDCGLSLDQPTPAATLTADSPTGLGAVTGVVNLVGGSGYSAGTTAVVVDDNGQGDGVGAVPVLTIIGGVITAVTFPPGSQGANYSFPALVFNDPANTGSGAEATCVLDTSATFSANLPVFSAGDVGSVIRMGGGIAKVTAFTDQQHVVAQILSPITSIIANSGLGNAQPRVLPQASGNWTLTKPQAKVTGLGHLIGATVTGLADGNVVSPRVVAADGSVTLDAPASAVTLGLGFQAQLQSVYLDAGEPTVQGQRKKIAAVTARVELSRGIKVGSNQVDGSTLSPPQIAPVWNNMADAPDKAVMPYNGIAVPLYTGDVRVTVEGGFQTPGQVAVQQDNPLPMQILSFIPEFLPGDTPQLKVEPRRGQQAAA